MLVRKRPRSSRLFWNITRIMLIEAKFCYSVMMCGRRLERGQWPWVRPQAWNSRSAPPPWWPGLVAHLGAAGDISDQGLPKSWWAVLLQKRGAIHKHFRMHLVRTYVCERIRRLENLLCILFSFGCGSLTVRLTYFIRCAKEHLLSFHCLDGLKLCHSLKY